MHFIDTPAPVTLSIVFLRFWFAFARKGVAVNIF